VDIAKNNRNHRWKANVHWRGVKQYRVPYCNTNGTSVIEQLIVKFLSQIFNNEQKQVQDARNRV